MQPACTKQSRDMQFDGIIPATTPSAASLVGGAVAAGGKVRTLIVVIHARGRQRLSKARERGDVAIGPRPHHAALLLHMQPDRGPSRGVLPLPASRVLAAAALPQLPPLAVHPLLLLLLCIRVEHRILLLLPRVGMRVLRLGRPRPVAGGARNR